MLKNKLDLNKQQKEKLEEVKKIVPKLGKMHQLKEELREIFDNNKTWVTGLFNLLDWLQGAATEFPKSQKTIIRWFGEVVGYFEQRTTNGIVEGINNKLKLIKRSAYGFRNFDNFRLRSLLTWHFNS